MNIEIGAQVTFIFKHVWVVCVNACLHTACMPGAHLATKSPETGVINSYKPQSVGVVLRISEGYELTCGYLELNPGPPEEQPALLIAGPSLQQNNNNNNSNNDNNIN